ncbi:MAG: hypothetical protein ACPG5B_10455 [Chitinophagales bacterium]
MHKEQWVFYGKERQHLIQFAHFANLNKIIVRLNEVNIFDEVLKAEEKARKLTFFVDGELCIIDINKTEKGYTYEFKTPEFSTSKVGKLRKWRDTWQKIGMMAAAIFIFSFFTYLAISNIEEETTLAEGGMTTEAVVISALPTFYEYMENGEKMSSEATITYKFKIHELYQYGKAPAQIIDGKVTDMIYGLPVKKHDRFEVLFAPKKTAVNEIRWKNFSETQLYSYKTLALERCMDNHTEFSNTLERIVYCDCQHFYFSEHYGLRGIAHLFYEKASVATNPIYNKVSFNKLKNEALHQKIEEMCVEKAKE